MNSKYAKLALPGLMMGLALGLSVPAASFAQDHDWHGGGSSHAGDNHGGNRGAPQRGPQGGPGGHPQPGAYGAPHGAPPPGGGIQAHVAAGAPGYRGAPGHASDWHGGPVNGGARFDWHGDARFNGYAGVRMGFYFAPGRGYYHVPPQWYGHHWGRGEFLPRFFFSYRIYDPDYYDLPYPPYGCAWMFVGEDAVLVDLDTGQIIDVMYGVF